jgi:hypothetical protein
LSSASQFAEVIFNDGLSVQLAIFETELKESREAITLKIARGIAGTVSGLEIRCQS